jgi:3-deoxy-manno-octulosonate cytidylyltransferase (CMP-KDO synthetase)
MTVHKRLHFTGIIPARYASSRFPGKPLANIGDRSMIQRVYEQASKSLENVYVATDDERIMKAVVDFGGNVIMTSTEHSSGTDRCSEAVSKIEAESKIITDVVINIQGDEPFIKPGQIDLLVSCFDDDDVDIATLICKADTTADIISPNQIKVVISVRGDALYFSRANIPYLRDVEINEWPAKHNFYKHLGIYGFKKHILKEVTQLKRSSLEIAESLEQNRWLENGYKIRTALTKWDSVGIDTPEDIERTKGFLKDFDLAEKV